MSPLPPPPRRMDWVKNRNEEEGQIKEMVVVEGDSITINESIRDDLLFEILLRLPALDIYFGARLVCRKWYHMVRANNFIHKHLERSHYGLLYTDVSNNLVFLSAREDGGIDKINYPFNFDYISIFSSTWNGLRSEYKKSMGELDYYNVRNILTGQAFRLPPFSYIFHYEMFIGYDAASMRYKVVLLKKLELEFAILTVGVDKSWRTVCADHLSLDGKCALLSTSIITEGFVHWNDFDESYQVVTLNLETETITETSLPIFEVKDDGSTKYCCFSTGRYISFFIMHSQLVWEALEMKPETGEWRKLTNICLEGKMEDIERLGFKHDVRPYGWLKYPDVLALRIQRQFIIFYNLSTCEISTEKLSFTFFNSCITPHKNSLVSF